MPIANRYYERVRGWSPQGLGTIADTHKFQPITDKVRQVDHHGGYTAGAGHALYTARRYPQQYWNRTAFVCGPTGHLVGTFVLKPDGADFTSHSPCNLIASDDEWTAPIAAEVGPDGNVWVLDWYNYIVQHNPTPHGFKTGKGNAYESDLRDKKHGRIYRVVYGDEIKPISLADASPEELVGALTNDNMLWRLHAQRLLVERGNADIVPQLIKLMQDERSDEIGVNAGAIHALRVISGVDSVATPASIRWFHLKDALQHSSAAVRQNMIASLPSDGGHLTEELLASGVLEDENPQVRLAALLNLSDASLDGSLGGAVGQQVAEAIVRPENYGDRWLLDAATSAGANDDLAFLRALSQLEVEPPSEVLPRVSIVAENFARRRPTGIDISLLLRVLPKAPPKLASGIITGVATGWPKDHRIELHDGDDESIEIALEKSPPATQGQLLKLASDWGSKAAERHTEAIVKSLLATVADAEKPADARQRRPAAR